CRERGLPWVEVAGGGQPRHRLGWLVTPVLAALGLDDGVDEAIALLREVGRDYARAVPLVDNPAKRLASRLAGGGLAALYGAAGLGSVAAYRLKCQLNENAELPALSGELPEMNHNEIVAWPRSKGADVRGVVWIRDPLGEHERVRARFSITQRLVNEHFAWREELVARGTAPLARLASLLGLVDLASVYTAIALDRDPTPIGPIVRLKQELGH
ncbi:MAG TPA: SIS domain-containing protein, partial [Egibacteraceae bacterium]|nr:SIS domain-containing protein [Egibacteraceae bacterium]